MNPCNSTHKPRVFEGQRLAKAASLAPLKPARRVGHDPTYEKDMILLNKNRFVLVIPLALFTNRSDYIIRRFNASSTKVTT